MFYFLLDIHPADRRPPPFLFVGPKNQMNIE